MKQNMRKRTPLAVLLALCLAMQLCVPAAMASNRLMRAGRRGHCADRRGRGLPRGEVFLRRPSGTSVTARSAMPRIIPRASRVKRRSFF